MKLESILPPKDVTLAANPEMANIVAIYEEIEKRGLKQLNTGRMVEDSHLLEGCNDQRLGISLYAVPDAATRNRFSNVVAELLDIEPDQYGYGCNDFHLTFLSLAGVSRIADVSKQAAERYCGISSRVLLNARPVRVFYDGLIISPEGIIVKGYPCDQELNAIRDCLREELSTSGFDSGVDKRYRLQSAHNTIFRFRQPLRQASVLKRRVEAFSETLSGYVEYSTARLSIHDWYMKEESVALIKEFPLSG